MANSFFIVRSISVVYIYVVFHIVYDNITANLEIEVFLSRFNGIFRVCTSKERNQYETP